MKKFDIIICYDISCSKRLKKVVKILESVSYRVQYSIFLYPRCTKCDVQNIVKQILDIVDQHHDDIRIYKIDIKRSLSLNNAVDLHNPNLIL